MEEVEQIDITPDISLLPKMGASGHNAPQAVAELVDNSIDAANGGEKLTVNIQIKKGEITVADNGSGMDKDTISNAMKLAHSEKKGQLGEFGIGLKTACLSLGSTFKVTSKTKGEEKEYEVIFDEAEWEENGEDWKLELKKRKSNKNNHFTIVEIKGIKVFYPNLPGNIRADLQKRYAPFIRSGEVELKVNGRFCKPEERELIEETRKEFNLTTKSGVKLSGWFGLLKEGSQKGFYGFDTFRRGRMITSHDKIGFQAHPTLARIVGELHLNDVPVSNTKREFKKESLEYREVEEVMKEELRELVKLARQKAGREKVKKDIKREVQNWKEKITEVLRDDDFRQYTAIPKEEQVKRNEKGGEVKEVDVEKRGERKNINEHKPENKEENPRTPKKTHKKRRNYIRIKGRNIAFEHYFESLGMNESWKSSTISKEKGIEIFTNTDFPAYHATKDKVFYAVIHIAEVISEVMVNSTGEDIGNIDELKELILRKASEIKIELK